MRVFETRDVKPMITLFKSLVLPKCEYCSQLWSPSTIGLIRKLEGVQRFFTSKINGMRDLNYWERLAKLKLYSMERRRDRYMIIYIYKIINNLVPNISNDNHRISTREHPRRGKLCEVPSYNTRAMAYVRTIREGSFSVHAPRLFNILPKDIRAHSGSTDSFKRRLDEFLRTVPDRPTLPHYYQSAQSNSLLDQVGQQRRDEMNLYVPT